MATNKDFSILITGTGFSGICVGIQLKKAGIHNFTIVEKANDVGGTWRDNTYPGAACDVKSNLYSYSFEPNPNWTRAYSPQAEISGIYKTLCKEIRFRQAYPVRLGSESSEIRRKESNVGSHQSAQRNH
jgi:cation diffusion facilitator CzcD-associated flavoprotein CzcO